jgi:hypothetical protein
MGFLDVKETTTTVIMSAKLLLQRLLRCPFSTFVLDPEFYNAGMGCEHPELSELSGTAKASTQEEPQASSFWNNFCLYEEIRFLFCDYRTLFLTLVLTYVSLAVIVNLFNCYKFVVAWNLIAQTQNDMSFMNLPPVPPPPQSTTTSTTARSRMRHLWQQNRNNNHKACLVVPAHMKHLCCPICLNDFFEQELVSGCDDGCQSWFHKECLAEWLDRADSCPCCRRDMTSPTKRMGWMNDLSVFLGYPPH